MIAHKAFYVQCRIALFLMLRVVPMVAIAENKILSLT
jgi:hypothetical protein